MTHYLNIPEDFERSEELSGLMNKILNVITIDSAFLSEKQREGNAEYWFVTLLVDANNDPLPNEVVSLVSKIGREHPDFSVRVYTEHQSETGLERGSLYFLEHCCLGKTVFAHPEGENIMDFSERVHKNLVYRAKRYHGTETRKIRSFANTAETLIEDGDLSIAAFNMHQAFELSFRFIEQMCIGQARTTHSIISHIKYCGPFFPTLNPFSKNPELEQGELLLLLEHAYSVARYGSEFEITKAQALEIQTELKRFIEQVESIFQEHLDTCKNRIGATNGVPGDGIQGGPRKAESNDETSLLAQLKRMQREHFHLLKPHIPEKGLYGIELATEGYSETSSMIANLIKVCILALETENWSTRVVPQPGYNVREVLGYVLDLIPHEEMDFLDGINELLETAKNQWSR